MIEPDYGEDVLGLDPREESELQELRLQLEKAEAEVLQWKGYAETLQRMLEEQKRANDELFQIKQKVVIANRELTAKVAELQR